MNKKLLLLWICLLITLSDAYSQEIGNYAEVDDSSFVNSWKYADFHSLSDSIAIAIKGTRCDVFYLFKNKSSHFITFKESPSGAFGIKFTNKSDIQFSNQNQTLIYQVNVDKGSYRIWKFSDIYVWYKLLGKGYSDFFNTLTYFPTYHFNDWYKKEKGIRFDYFPNLYLTDTGNVYLTHHFIVYEMNYDDLYQFIPEHSFLIPTITENSHIIYINENNHVLIYSNGYYKYFFYNFKTSKTTLLADINKYDGIYAFANECYIARTQGQKIAIYRYQRW